MKQPSSSFVSEQELLKKLAQQDQRAFHWLYDQYAPVLYGVVLRMVQDEALAQYIIQEVFRKAWSKLSSYDSRRGTLFGWMLHITRQTAFDALQKRQHPPNPNTAWQPPANSYLFDASEIEQLMQPQHRQLIESLFFGGQPYLPPHEPDTMADAFRQRIRAALQELKEIFKS